MSVTPTLPEARLKEIEGRQHRRGQGDWFGDIKILIASHRTLQAQLHALQSKYSDLLENQHTTRPVDERVADLMRQLQAVTRERDEARARASDTHDEIYEAKTERDSAREQLAVCVEALTFISNDVDMVGDELSVYAAQALARIKGAT